MSSSPERIFILGGTGNIGTVVVNDLLKKNIAVTLYARDPKKVESLYPNHGGLVNIVQGEFKDLAPLKNNIAGHSRLFLLVFGFERFAETKEEVAKAAYDAGVKQIVDISSFTVNMGWRTSLIGSHHYDGEKRIMDLPNRGRFVALRPGRFMANLLTGERPLQAGNKIFDVADHPVGWISTNDIGAVAAVVLCDDIEKHGDAVYSLTGDVLTPTERAAVYTRVLGQEVSVQKITPAQKYQKMMSLGYYPFPLVMDLCCGLESFPDARVTPEIEILLGREPETFEKYLTANKASHIQ